MGNYFGRDSPEELQPATDKSGHVQRCSTICVEKFQDLRFVPCCGNTFCLECLERVTDANGDVALVCPACRTPQVLGTTEQLPRHISIAQIMDDLDDTAWEACFQQPQQEILDDTAQVCFAVPAEPSKTLSILLIGAVGNGKSALANTILGRYHFAVSASPERCTAHVESVAFEFNGYRCNVVDAPGLSDDKTSRDATLDCLRQKWRREKPEFAAIFFVFKFPNRVTIEPELFEILRELLRLETLEKHAFVVITNARAMSEEQHRAVTEEIYLSNIAADFLNRIQGRVLFVENELRDVPTELAAATTSAAMERQRVLGNVLCNLVPHDTFINVAPPSREAAALQVRTFYDLWFRAATYFAKPADGDAVSVAPMSLVAEVAQIADTLVAEKRKIFIGVLANTVVGLLGGGLMIGASVASGGAAAPLAIAAGAASAASISVAIATSVTDVLVERTRQRDARKHYDDFLRLTEALSEAIFAFNKLTSASATALAQDRHFDVAEPAAADLLVAPFLTIARVSDDIAGNVASLSATGFSQAAWTLSMVFGAIGLVADAGMLLHVVRKLLDPHKRVELAQKLRRDLRRVVAELLKVTQSLCAAGVLTEAEAQVRKRRIVELQADRDFACLIEQSDVPDPPQNLVVRRNDLNGEFAWEAPTYCGGTEVTSYELRSSERGIHWNVEKVDITGTTFLLPTPPGKRKYRLFAKNAAGRSCGSLLAADA